MLAITREMDASVSATDGHSKVTPVDQAACGFRSLGKCCFRAAAALSSSALHVELKPGSGLLAVLTGLIAK